MGLSLSSTIYQMCKPEQIILSDFSSIKWEYNNNKNNNNNNYLQGLFITNKNQTILQMWKSLQMKEFCRYK